jgi:sulfoacetaldehyde acetyltransferase
MTLGLGGFQETEQLPIFSKITKYQAHVNNRARMAELTSRAFDRALLELGPTQLNIPRDYFYGDIECEIPRPLSIERGAGGKQSLDDAAALLAEAKFPVLVCGGGVVMADAQAEAIALAELLQAPVANSYLHNDSFPADHPLWCGPLGYQGSKAAMKLIAKADVVLALGTRLGRSARCRSTGLITGRPRRRSSRSTPIRGCWAWSSRSRWASAAMRRPRRGR